MLSYQDYNNLCQCESLEDVKLNLQETDYDQFLAQENKVTPAALQDKATKKLVGLALLYPSVSHSVIRFLRFFIICTIIVFLLTFLVALRTNTKKGYTGQQHANAIH